MEFRTVEYRWLDDVNEEWYQADVHIGDGSIRFDDKWDGYDERVFFYFENSLEFELAKHGTLNGAEFVVREVQ